MADQARRRPEGKWHRRRRGGEAEAGAGGGGRVEVHEALVRELLAELERNLRDTIEELKSERPLDYLRLVAAVLGGGSFEWRGRAGRRQDNP